MQLLPEAINYVLTSSVYYGRTKLLVLLKGVSQQVKLSEAKRQYLLTS